MLATLRICIDVPFYWAAGRPVTPQSHDLSQGGGLVTTAIGKAQMKYATAVRSDFRDEFN
jgi:hypothetical protein